MRTVVGVIALIAVIAVALSGVAARAADPGPALQFELVDGTVITGRIGVKAIPIRISTGNVLKIPVAELKELTVGLNDCPGFVQRVETLVKALDSDKTREDALRKLISLGPPATPIVKHHAASDISARRAAVAEILKVYKSWRADHPAAPEAMGRPLEPRSKVRADVNVFMGTVTVDGFRIVTPYGPATVKLDEVRRIRPAEAQTARVISSKLGRLVVALRDKTSVEGTVISGELRLRTRYGAMVVPLAQIQKATFAADGKSVRVQCWGSDRIVGTIGSGVTISLKTNKGRVDLSAGKIAVMFYWPLTLRGHSGGVCCVAFSLDGKRMASGSFDKTIKLWDTATGTELLALKGHSGWVRCVAFSPDGRRLASGSDDKTIKLWDTATGKALITLKGHSDKILSVAFSPDGKSLASGGLGKPFKLWDTAGGKELFTFKGYSGTVWSVAFSPDGKGLALGNGDGTIKILDVRDWTGAAKHTSVGKRK